MADRTTEYLYVGNYKVPLAPPQKRGNMPNKIPRSLNYEHPSHRRFKKRYPTAGAWVAAHPGRVAGWEAAGSTVTPIRYWKQSCYRVAPYMTYGWSCNGEIPSGATEITAQECLEGRR
jgi:hypothetical protein